MSDVYRILFSALFLNWIIREICKKSESRPCVKLCPDNFSTFCGWGNPSPQNLVTLKYWCANWLKYDRKFKKTRHTKRHIFTVPKTAAKPFQLILKKTCSEINLPVTTNNITTTLLQVLEASNSSNIPNNIVKAFNGSWHTSPSSSRSYLLSLYSKKENILKIEARLAEFKGYVKNCDTRQDW